jgi:N-glycosylase/DNA lyase
MNVKFNGNDIIVSEIDCLDLDLTLDCGQAFRWEKQNDGSYSGVAGAYFLNISKNGDDIIFKNTTKDSFDNFWINYFDLNKDYKSICDTLKKDKLLSSTIDEYYGIRILNQDSWEALCSFVISQQNNIKRIKLIIERLCKSYGDDLGNGYYTFPTAQRLSTLSVKDFEDLGTGYRAKYLERLAKDVANGIIDLDKIKSLPLDEARKELMNIYGVGIKVANCALLFGFQFYSAFPVDVWMKRVMEYYPNGLPECFNGYEGIAQQYLFHWARNNLKG